MTGADFGEVDIDLLADYIGGALTGTAEESAVAARVADDPAWQAAYESLGEGMSFVSAELSRIRPEPMPAGLADRLDTMLTISPAGETTAGRAADEFTASRPGDQTKVSAPHEIAASRSGGENTAGGEDTAGRAGDEIKGSRPGDEITAWRAGVAPGAIADPEPIAPDLAKPPVPHLALVRGDSAGGDGAHGVRETQPAPRRGRRLRWAAPIAVAAGLIAFVGFGLDYLAGREHNSASTDSAAGSADARAKAPKVAPTAGSEQTLASGIDYTHATLGIAPVQPMSGALTSPDTPGRKTAPEMASGVESALRRLTAPSALADCLAAIEKANAGGTLSAESIDYARFDGAPAVIVRFTAGNGQWAWASGADCGTPPGDAATLDKVPVG